VCDRDCFGSMTGRRRHVYRGSLPQALRHGDNWSAPRNAIQRESEISPLTQKDKTKAKSFTDEQIVAILQEAVATYRRQLLFLQDIR